MAEFYGDIAGADAYHVDRGHTEWDGTDPAKTAALIRASDWLDATYGPRFGGYKTGGRTQVRLWPRTDAADAVDEDLPTDEVPVEIERATYEAALRELNSPGSLQPDVKPGGLFRSVSVEGAVSVEYADASPWGQRPILSVVDGILASLLSRRVGGSNFALVRG